MMRKKLILTTFATVALLIQTSQGAQVHRIEKPLPPTVTDLQQAQVIEIRNDAGAVVLTGTLPNKNNDKASEIRRKVKLSGPSGSGSAAVHVSTKNGQTKDQELELELERLLYGGAYKVFVDTKEIYAFSADSRGKASVKLSSKN